MAKRDIVKEMYVGRLEQIDEDIKGAKRTRDWGTKRQLEQEKEKLLKILEGERTPVEDYQVQLFMELDKT